MSLGERLRGVFVRGGVSVAAEIELHMGGPRREVFGESSTGVELRSLRPEVAALRALLGRDGDSFDGVEVRLLRGEGVATGVPCCVVRLARGEAISDSKVFSSSSPSSKRFAVFRRVPILDRRRRLLACMLYRSRAAGLETLPSSRLFLSV